METRPGFLDPAPHLDKLADTAARDEHRRSRQASRVHGASRCIAGAASKTVAPFPSFEKRPRHDVAELVSILSRDGIDDSLEGNVEITIARLQGAAVT